jgi:bifunctional DNase/RNase
VDTKVKLQVQGLTNSPIHYGTYALILAEAEGERHVSITVGIAEAQSIAIALEQIIPPRPLTHDLIHSLLRMYDIRLVEIYINKCEDDIFYSELLLEKNGQQIRIDSRTSDAIAIAIRMKCDIYANEQVLQDYGIEMTTPSIMREEEDDDDDDVENFILKDVEPEDIKNEAQLQKWLSLLQDSDLKYRIEKAVTVENYEYAKMYTDELSRREKENGGKLS